MIPEKMIAATAELRFPTEIASITINPPGLTRELVVDGKFFVKPR